MNRGHFTYLVTSFFALPTLALSCETTLVYLVASLGIGVSRLAQALGRVELAAKLRHDTDLITAEIKAWKQGQSAASIVHKLNNLIRDIKLVDDPAFKPLVTLSLGTAASIIEWFSSRGATGIEKPDTDIHLTSPPKNAHEFNQDWDDIRAGTPGLEKAPVL